MTPNAKPPGNPSNPPDAHVTLEFLGGALLALLTIGIVAMMLSGCLGAQDGQVGAAAGDAGSCGTATALTDVGDMVRQTALSDCGTAAWYEESWPQPLVHVRTPTGDVWPAIEVDANGWLSSLAISQDGTRVAVAIGQSDLGFGTTFVYERGTPDAVTELPYGSGGAIGFSAGRAWSCEPNLNYETHVSLEAQDGFQRFSVSDCGRLIARPNRLVVAPDTNGEVVISDSRGIRKLPITDFIGDAVHGDTLYFRHAMRLSPDGERLAIQELTYSVFDFPTYANGPISVFDLASDRLIAEVDANIETLVFAPEGHAFAAAQDQNTLWVADNGVETLLEDITPLALGGDGQLIGVDPGTGLITLVGSTGGRQARVADQAITSSRSAAAYAFTYADRTCALPGSTSTSTPDPSCATHSVGVWTGGEVQWRRRAAAVSQTIHWVGDDGALVVSQAISNAMVEVTAFDAAGVAVWQRETAEVGRVAGDGHTALVAVAGGPGQLLVAIDTRSGTSREVMSGQDIAPRLARLGPVVAITYEPQSGADTVLQLGAMPRL